MTLAVECGEDVFTLTHQNLTTRVWCDAAFYSEEGVGGIGIYAQWPRGTEEYSAAVPDAHDSTQLELFAAITAIEYVTRENPSGPVTLHTDYDTICFGLDRGVPLWRERNWKKTCRGGVRRRRTIAHSDLWERLWELARVKHDVVCIYVPRCQGYQARRVNSMARLAARKYRRHEHIAYSKRSTQNVRTSFPSKG